MTPSELCKNASKSFLADNCHQSPQGHFWERGREGAQNWLGNQWYSSEKCTNMHCFTQNTSNILWGVGIAGPLPRPTPLRMRHHSSNPISPYDPYHPTLPPYPQTSNPTNPTPSAPMAPRPPRLRGGLDVFGRSASKCRQLRRLSVVPTTYILIRPLHVLELQWYSIRELYDLYNQHILPYCSAVDYYIVYFA